MHGTRVLPRFGTGSFIVDRAGTILGFDEGMERLTLLRASEVVGQSKARISSQYDLLDKKRGPLYLGEIPHVQSDVSLELTLCASDGQRLEVEASTVRLDGPGERIQVRVLRVLGRSGVTPILGTNFVDELTGLRDRDAFHARLAAEFSKATECARPLGLVLADIDELRFVNDRFGRDAGDTVLKRFAGILRSQVIDEERIFRLEDDDFAILLPDMGRGDARQISAALRATVERFRFLPPSQKSPEVTLSLGAASYPADGDSPEQLFNRSRDALNEARRMGRNRVWCYVRRPRVPLEVPVYFDGSDALLAGYSRDLSPSGIFVQTSVPMEIGMRCALNFPLPGCENNVHAICRVVRTVATSVGWNSEAIRVPGMGVEFERFGASEDRRAIDGYLHHHESSSLRPETGILSV